MMRSLGNECGGVLKAIRGGVESDKRYRATAMGEFGSITQISGRTEVPW